ncbi:hypothetical protein NA57DRAFT_74688 [Rhizodiscina lignyota]|uniref:DUF6594 domain-containing protein n=1 Tax=Rhizodiscina lignyota TaxID=1504668 RepID=A0A9P4IKV4_9PEZI|nr:hypothetical protein NA57DRAFT_74688 [Rhizodiscina lignyota]
MDATVVDADDNVDNGQTGYPGLAELMGKYRDLNIFSRFATLNARNLIYMQAEILYLERELKVITWVKHKSPLDADRAYEREASTLISSMENEDSQWNIVLKIREKLKEYNRALLLQSKINHLPRARRRNLKILQQTLLSHNQPDTEFDEWTEIWDAERISDLISLAPRSDLDWLKRVFKHDAPLIETKEEYYHAISKAFSVVLSAAIISATVLALYYIPSLHLRVLSIVPFTLLFATAVAVFTTARSAEIFGATAAYAAVSVVFVGSTSIM